MRSAGIKMRSWKWKALGRNPMIILWKVWNGAKETTLPRVIYSLGIANIGLANAKVICRHFDNDLDRIRHASLEEVSDIDTIGPVIAGNLVAYFRDEDNDRRLDHLMSFLHIQEDSSQTGTDL